MRNTATSSMITPEQLHYFLAHPDGALITRDRAYFETIEHHAHIKLLDPNRAHFDARRKMNTLPRIVYGLTRDVFDHFFKCKGEKLTQCSFRNIVMEQEVCNGLMWDTAIFLHLKPEGGNEEICTLSSPTLGLYRSENPDKCDDPPVTIKLGEWYGEAIKKGAFLQMTCR